MSTASVSHFHNKAVLGTGSAALFWIQSCVTPLLLVSAVAALLFVVMSSIAQPWLISKYVLFTQSPAADPLRRFTDDFRADFSTQSSQFVLELQPRQFAFGETRSRNFQNRRMTLAACGKRHNGWVEVT